MIIFSG